MDVFFFSFSSFNSNVVRLKGNQVDVRFNMDNSFNSNVVRLKGQEY